MEFLNPTALFGLLALPLLLIPYLIRRKPRRVLFSSLLLFADTGARASGKPWGRLRLPPIFFLQLLLLALLVLALSEPVFSIRPNRIAIVLDNSASMQALENGRSRFQRAQLRAQELLADVGLNGKIDLYLTTPRLEKIRGTTFAPSEARGVIASLQAYDIGDRPMDYDRLLSDLAEREKYDRLYLISDHPVSSQGEKVRAISVGTPQDNLAITSFQLSHALAEGQLRASVEVTNYSAQEARTTLALSGSGAVIARRDVVIAAGKSASVSFDSVPRRPYFEAEIAARDALLLDNRSFAVSSARQSLRILGISPRPEALSSLRQIAGVTLNLVAPGDYEKSERTDYDLEIFHFATPADLPQTAALFVLPPDNNPLVDLAKPLSRPVVSNWREPHPLTRYVNFSLIRPAYARPLRPQAPGEIIADSPEGPLIFAGQRRGTRYLVLGFDPFPYLGRGNLPMSVLTLNLLDWFFEGAGARGKATGDALTFGGARPGDIIVSPRGDKVNLRSGANSFTGTFFQGVYQLNRGDEKELFAVNLQDANESDLRRAASIAIRGGGGAQRSASALFAFWPYLLLASLLLLIVEWFIRPGAGRSGFKAMRSEFFGNHA